MLIRSVAIISLVAVVGAPRAQPVIYVDVDAPGPVHDGSSWCNAFVRLSDALAAAVQGDTVKVAAGVYVPDPTGLPDPREATLQLISGVSIEGGYAGCGEVDPNERDQLKCSN